MAIDLLNVLVARYHAGQPSDVHAVRLTLDTVNQLIQQYHPSILVFAAEGGDGHRQKLYADYKAHRPQQPELLRRQIKICKQAIEAIGWPVLWSPGYEADDVLATLATQCYQRADDIILVTSDKDLLPFCRSATIHNPATKSRVTPKSVSEKFGINPDQVSDYLALTGDTSDNIPGGDGIGAVTAAKLLTEYRTLDGVLRASESPVGSLAKALAKVAKCRVSIELSVQLVQLATDVPIDRWWDSSTRPRPGWEQRLQSLGLAASANRLRETFSNLQD